MFFRLLDATLLDGSCWRHRPREQKCPARHPPVPKRGAGASLEEDRRRGASVRPLFPSEGGPRRPGDHGACVSVTSGSPVLPPSLGPRGPSSWRGSLNGRPGASGSASHCAVTGVTQNSPPRCEPHGSASGTSRRTLGRRPPSPGAVPASSHPGLTAWDHVVLLPLRET